jgi:hypothetical protein
MVGGQRPVNLSPAAVGRGGRSVAIGRGGRSLATGTRGGCPNRRLIQRLAWIYRRLRRQ